MPTYEYQCQNCGYRVEYFQSMKEPPRTECPRCQGEIKRMVSKGAGLIFKGTGFYITDYKKREDKSSKKGNGHTKPPKKKSTEPKKESAKKVTSD
jgi:putative FmdB family regulatory protein